MQEDEFASRFAAIWHASTALGLEVSLNVVACKTTLCRASPATSRWMRFVLLLDFSVLLISRWPATPGKGSSCTPPR